MFGKFLTLLLLVTLASCVSVSHELSRRAFDWSTHLGNLSPYFNAPVPPGMDTELPADCTVDQVMLVRVLSSPTS
jgi:acid phosphatase